MIQDGLFTQICTTVRVGWASYIFVGLKDSGALEGCLPRGDVSSESETSPSMLLAIPSDERLIGDRSVKEGLRRSLSYMPQNREIQIGYKLTSEEFSATDLVRQARAAEEHGFAFASISDHYHPWTDRQGQSPFVWSVIGGIAHRSQLTRSQQ